MVDSIFYLIPTTCRAFIVHSDLDTFFHSFFFSFDWWLIVPGEVYLVYFVSCNVHAVPVVSRSVSVVQFSDHKYSCLSHIGLKDQHEALVVLGRKDGIM